MSQNDWLKLHRCILESEVFDGDPWILKLWVWCLCRANFLPGSFRGERLEAGQFVTGRMRAAEELKVAPSKWLRGMQKLSDMNQISMKSNNQWTTVTICKWSIYQSNADEKQEESDNDRTTSDTTIGQRVIQRSDTIEEEKERQEEKEPKPAGGVLFPDGSEKPVKTRKPKDIFDPMLAVDPSLRTDAFMAVWSEWIQHRREKKEPLTPTSVRKQMKSLAMWGQTKAIAAIENSIAGGWTGIFEPKTNGKATHANGAGQVYVPGFDHGQM